MLRFCVFAIFATVLASGAVLRPNSVKGFKLLRAPYSPVGECPVDHGLPTFLPDSDNCQLYYECSNGEAVQNHCPDNLQWNTVLNSCDFPENVNCDKGKSSKKSKAVHPLSAVGECPDKEGLPTFLPDSDNCQIYYECSNGEPVKNHCPDNLQWNTVLNSCDFPENVKCDKGKKAKMAHPFAAVGECPHSPEGIPTFLPDSDNCQLYYECSNGEAVQNHCPDNLQWNTVLNSCDFPENVNCGQSKSKRTKTPYKPVGECPVPQGSLPVYLPDSDDCTIFYECDAAGVPVQKECMPGLEFNAVTHVCEYPETAKCTAGSRKPKFVHPLSAVGVCPPNEGLPTFLPDSDDCQIYYECSNGEAVKNHCPHNLQWNTVLNSCDFPENVNCGKSKKSKVPYKPVGECPIPQGEFPVYLPDSDDCTIFYECNAVGEPVQKDCMPGLEFNPVLNVCDFPESAGCKAGSRKPKFVHPLSAVGECPDKEGLPTFLPDSDNCQIYYECSNGEPVKNHCPDSLQWNTVLNSCDFPENVNCGPSKSKRTKTPYKPVGECPIPQGEFPVYLPDSDDCTIFYECNAVGEPVQKECMPGLEFNPVLNVCDFPESAGCKAGSRKPKFVHPLSAVGECPDKEGLPTFLPDSDNCQIYYECSNGEPVKNHCPDNLQWNTVLNSCDFPENVKCDKGKKVKMAYPFAAVGQCPHSPEGTPTFLPDSDNCQLYYECSNGEAVQNHCPDNLQWNTVLNSCDFPENVNCNKGKSSKKSKAVHPLSAVGECPDKEGLPTFLPDSDNCQIYYECSNGEPVKNHCPDNLQWNTVLNSCDFPENVKCGQSKSKRTKTPYKPVGECPVPQGSLPVYLPDSDDCSIFYECDAAGVPVQKECMPGLEFNPVTHVCEYPTTAGCKAGSRLLKLIPLMRMRA